MRVRAKSFLLPSLASIAPRGFGVSTDRPWSSPEVGSGFIYAKILTVNGRVARTHIAIFGISRLSKVPLNLRYSRDLRFVFVNSWLSRDRWFVAVFFLFSNSPYGMGCSHWKTVKFKVQPPADAQQNAGSLTTMLSRETHSSPVLVLERQLRLRVGQLKLVDRTPAIGNGGPDPNGRLLPVACPDRWLRSLL
ncbi:uncharacterized protein LOC125957513 isoform X1 [Anopheles darlingi]|uniref:uncharacterized protein LOC125957513 isoform X1 n=1 Tax=Anopheles darlingi TaxID=43151 RepID=UPI00210050A8|nr:uncharacterized protein LOC125957513 isoform X1 [Anopheles darlingi]